MDLMNPKTGYLNTAAVYEPDIDVYMILGQRADGKTYGFIRDIITRFNADGTPAAYIRRFDESLKKHMIADLCKPHSKTIAQQTKKQWTDTTFKSKRFYFTRYEDDKPILAKNPFLYTYALNTWETAKGADSGEFSAVIFDEFVSASKYLPNETVIFDNVLSSILRNRGKSKIIMLGNPINQICPYFDEFGLDVHKLNPGDVVYRMAKTGAKMKFCYLPAMDKKKRFTAKFFDFKENSSISTGYWDFGEFPHLPAGTTKQADFLGKFHVIFRKQFAVCEFYHLDGVIFAFWRPGNPDKIVDDKETITYSDAHIFQANYLTAWNAFDDFGKLYKECVNNNRQYFADNRTGNLVKMWYQEFLQKAGRFV